MKRAERKTIENIIAVMPHIYKWQDEIEKEQEKIIGDLISPAKKVVAALIALDNRRIDLCNLKVLNAFIKRGLGERFSELKEIIGAGVDSPLFNLAKSAISRCGYDVERANREFKYLFDKLPKKRRKRIIPSPTESVPEVYGAV